MSFIKIAIVNNSGNVGKTTIANILLKPRIHDSVVIAVEDINHVEYDANEKFTGNEFIEIFQAIDINDAAIVDIGSSNIKDFVSQLSAFKGSADDFDYFLIPVTPVNKQIVDSIATMEMLLDLDIGTERIRFIFNSVSQDVSFEKQFSDLLSNKTFKSLKIKNHSIIPQTTVFTNLSAVDKNYHDVLFDERDFRELMKAASKDDRAILSHDRSLKRQVQAFETILDEAFNKLNLSY